MLDAEDTRVLTWQGKEVPGGKPNRAKAIASDAFVHDINQR